MIEPTMISIQTRKMMADDGWLGTVTSCMAVVKALGTIPVIFYVLLCMYTTPHAYAVLYAGRSSRKRSYTGRRGIYPLWDGGPPCLFCFCIYTRVIIVYTTAMILSLYSLRPRSLTLTRSISAGDATRPFLSFVRIAEISTSSSWIYRYAYGSSYKVLQAMHLHRGISRTKLCIHAEIILMM